jgi:HPt (histidine-containing phosphotransfer) domain-containing protein
MQATFGETDAERFPRSLLLEPAKAGSGQPSFAPGRLAANLIDSGLSECGEPLPLNLEELKRRCMGRMDFAARLLASFENRFPAEVAEIAKCLELQDVAGLARLVHQLKGTTANICAPSLNQIVQQIEELVQAGQLTDIPRRLALLDSEWQRFIVFKQSLSGASKP